MTRTALIAGQGALPRLMAAALEARGEPFLVAQLDGFPADLPGHEPVTFRLERLVPFLDHLAGAGVERVVFAGSVRRPRLEADLFDPRTAQVFSDIFAGFRSGDDALLGAILDLFESWGFSVVGADAITPDLVPGAGLLTGTPSPADEADAARAAGIVATLGPLDIGQGAVVAQGLCLAVETLPGTDAMLRFAALHAGLKPDPAGAKGVLYKAPKPGQDRRVDLPTLGAGTVRAARAAGLAGVVWQAGGVLLLDRAAMVAEAEAGGLFLWSRP